jgi:hypothetical protein
MGATRCVWCHAGVCWVLSGELPGACFTPYVQTYALCAGRHAQSGRAGTWSFRRTPGQPVVYSSGARQGSFFPRGLHCGRSGLICGRLSQCSANSRRVQGFQLSNARPCPVGRDCRPLPRR